MIDLPKQVSLVLDKLLESNISTSRAKYVNIQLTLNGETKTVEALYGAAQSSDEDWAANGHEVRDYETVTVLGRGVVGQRKPKTKLMAATVVLRMNKTNRYTEKDIVDVALGGRGYEPNPHSLHFLGFAPE